MSPRPGLSWAQQIPCPLFPACCTLLSSLCHIKWNRLSWRRGSGGRHLPCHPGLPSLRAPVEIPCDSCVGRGSRPHATQQGYRSARLSVSLHRSSMSMLGKAPEWATAQLKTFWGKGVGSSMAQKLGHSKYIVVDDYNAPLKVVVSWEGKESKNFIFLENRLCILILQ